MAGKVPQVLDGMLYGGGRALRGIYNATTRPITEANKNHTWAEKIGGREVKPGLMKAVKYGIMAGGLAKGVFSGFQNSIIGRVDPEVKKLAGTEDYPEAQMAEVSERAMPLANMGADGELTLALHRLRNQGQIGRR